MLHLTYFILILIYFYHTLSRPWLHLAYSLQNRQLIQGTRVLSIMVKDGDLGSPRSLRLSLVGDTKGYFALEEEHVDEKGVTRALLVTSNNLLDREDADILDNGGLYSFNIKVSISFWVA